jgi:hypothetical protein
VTGDWNRASCSEDCCWEFVPTLSGPAQKVLISIRARRTRREACRALSPGRGVRGGLHNISSRGDVHSPAFSIPGPPPNRAHSALPASRASRPALPPSSSPPERLVLYTLPPIPSRTPHPWHDSHAVLLSSQRRPVFVSELPDGHPSGASRRQTHRRHVHSSAETVGCGRSSVSSSCWVPPGWHISTADGDSAAKSA